MTSFDTRLSGIPTKLWQTITQIDEIKGEWRHASGLGPQLLGRLKRSVLVTSTGASTRIEGARLSDDEVERLMRGLSAQKLADRDAQEVRGYYEVLQLVFDAWDSIELTENTIKHLHVRLLQHTDKDVRHRGHYKTMDNKVQATDPTGQVVSVLFDATPAYLTAKQMSELVDWTNDAFSRQRHHPLLVIANFMVEFLKIHPFLDGNGRLSRVLTNLLMLRAGYGFAPYVSHEHLIETNKTDYYLALRRSQTTFGSSKETIQPWLEFFLTVCQTQAEQAMALLSRAAVEQLLSPSQRLVWEYLVGVEDAARVRSARRPTCHDRPWPRPSTSCSVSARWNGWGRGGPHGIAGRRRARRIDYLPGRAEHRGSTCPLLSHLVSPFVPSWPTPLCWTCRPRRRDRRTPPALPAARR